MIARSRPPLALLAAGLLLPPSVAAAQQPPAAAADSAAAQPDGGALQVFLDCDRHCDFDYLRTETPWVLYVRDRADADVHVIVTELGTASGGSEYTISLVGQRDLRTLGDTVRLVTRPNTADAVVRDDLTRTIQLGLVPFVLRTPQRSRLRLSLAEAGEGPARAMPANDPWKGWVFSIGVDGSLEREERQHELDVEGSLEASRITAQWKVGISGEGNFNRDRFVLDDGTATNTRESYRGGAVVVRSLGPHWGVGAETALSSSTFENTQLAVRAGPAVEYSVWPYDEATRRQLTLQYSMGISSFDYRELTIFDRMEETRPSQAVVVGYDTRQRWGSADAELEFASFLDDVEQFRLVFDGGVELRLFRGLSLDVNGSASLIRDQLAIAKRDATPEEILLRLRALSTDYRFDARIGLSYTFGSIFNSVVNPRFGTGPGQVLR